MREFDSPSRHHLFQPQNAQYRRLSWLNRAMAAIQYREASHQDVPALARIRAAEWETKEYWQKRITGYLDRTHHPQHALQPRIIYLAQEDDNVIGFVAGHLTRRFECEGELEWINVVKERRGRDIAATLLRHLAEWFASRNALRVCVDVSRENTIARRFYARHGGVDLKPHWMVWEDIRVALVARSTAAPPAK